VRRREFIALLSGAAVWPLAAHAQQPERMRRIGMLMAGAESDRQWQGNVAVFREALEKTGWKVGRNLQIDYRWRMNDVEATRAATADLLRLAPDVVLANGIPALLAAQQATRAVPIVFTVVSEPVAQGFVRSLAHPGGNTTGFTAMEPSIGGKWLQLLKEIAPRVTRVALVFNPEASRFGLLSSPSAEAAARKFGVVLAVTQIHDRAEIEPVMTKLASEPGGGLIFPTDSFINTHRRLVVELAARYRLPAVYSLRHYADDGGLVSYGMDTDEQYRQAAGYIDRILRDENPGDLPVQQPTKFELVINLKTAEALGLEISPTLIARADEVIE
jgi:putative ABC transport system substrate-binding protein